MKHVRTWFCGILLLVLLALPASAAELGLPDITPQMTMKEIRENPELHESGLFLYGNFGEGTSLTRRQFDQQTLEEYAWSCNAEETAAALNLVIRNVREGIKVTWQVYSPEEIATDPALGSVQLFYFPGKESGGKYALVLGGNALTINGAFGEGMPTAWELHEKGYTVFVLRYRAWTDLGDNAPLLDLGNAVNFITAHAESFGVQPQDYAIVGYSSGGQIAGVFANKTHGYGSCGALEPGALLLGYPVMDWTVFKTVYHVLYDPAEYGWRYYWTNLSRAVDDDYPPVYFWRGDNDTILGKNLWYYNTFETALQTHHVPYQRKAFANAPHAISVGQRTDASGWLDDAVAFWEAQCPQ